MRLTASEVICEMLVREGVPYVVGIAGHGNLPIVDGLRRCQDRIQLIMPRHEQAAVHLADGYFRAKGKPLAVLTSIGAGASNTPVGLATAYVDSIPLLLIIGETHTYMRGTGVLQEVERQRWSDLPRMLEPVVKGGWRIDTADQVPRAMAQALATMQSGRPGPVVVSVPMDVQAAGVEVDEVPVPARRRAQFKPFGDPEAIRRAAALLIGAERPVLLAGGGVTLADAEAELLDLAEHVGACVVTTMQGKSAFPETHPLYAWHPGSNGTTCGNEMTVAADVLIAVGVRFADKATSSYVAGESFSIPPTKLVQVDIDEREIGKNYPVEVGIVGDAKAVLSALLAAVRDLTPARDWQASTYRQEIAERVRRWQGLRADLENAETSPITMGRALAEIRKALPWEAIVLTSSGNVQAETFQQMPFTRPRTYLTAGGFSTMGWAYPAALGAKLAVPEAPVVALVGDGDFLMTIQELATAVQYDIAAVAVVLNNLGWQAIRDLQTSAFGAGFEYGTMFTHAGEGTTPNFADVARAFGVDATRVDRPGEVGPAIARAVALGRPAVVEVLTDASFGRSGGLAPGWWDVPVPAYIDEHRRAYEEKRAKERL